MGNPDGSAVTPAIVLQHYNVVENLVFVFYFSFISFHGQHSTHPTAERMRLLLSEFARCMWKNGHQSLRDWRRALEI